MGASDHGLYRDAAGANSAAVWLATRAPVIVRPLTAEDRLGFQALVRSMSPGSRYGRFQSALNELSTATLAMLTQVDQTSHVAFVAQSLGDASLIAEARYVVDVDKASGEFAIAVTDAWQGQGLGAYLLDILCRTADSAGLPRLEGEVLRTNSTMQALAIKAGFTARPHAEARKIRFVRPADAPRRPIAAPRPAA
jgi:acetyltransferase